MAEAAASPAEGSKPRRTAGGWVLLLVFWGLGLMSWLVWMGMIVYMVGRLFRGAE